MLYLDETRCSEAHTQLIFIWTDENIEHIESRHQVSPEEVEDIFYNNPHIRISNSQPNDPLRYLAFGQTDEGRYLMAVFIKTPDGNIKPFSAREMTVAEKRDYNKKRR